ncbi:NADH dehydrogenase [ubiquinone] iron-sulfur protein 4, mitochondrial-like [Diorhabda carinulata]|uniref:NADH dehydrogenase [ubiquinone] iron-sulfur protein 4, mitochondrial-like n=1 Tax=Diorhabda carinulata TaxID=1163345 RepID=UPI0025A1D197|nr:NADH dehydrogenase [ubiquinone] iron-sulfur protein 4, mitochondrial-like [Diorhabda carinulata]
MSLVVSKLSDVIFKPYLNYYYNKPSIVMCNTLKQDSKSKNFNEDLVPKNLEDDEGVIDSNVKISVPETISIELLRTEFDQLRHRVARISKPAKNCMQSGTNNTHVWQLRFDTKERWENPCIGYCSSGDPISNVVLKFSTKEEAIKFCEKNKWNFFSQDSSPKKFIKKSYADNFVYNKRHRVSTK